LSGGILSLAAFVLPQSGSVILAGRFVTWKDKQPASMLESRKQAIQSLPPGLRPVVVAVITRPVVVAVTTVSPSGTVTTTTTPTRVVPVVVSV
jgi:hypothetical protein